MAISKVNRERSSVARLTKSAAIGFSLLASSLTLSGTVVPQGGEKLYQGEHVEIAWSPHDFAGKVSVELWDGSKSNWFSIAHGVNGPDGFFDWIVPLEFLGNRYRIRVSQISNPQNFEMSGTYFTILPAMKNEPMTGVAGLLTSDIQITAHPSIGTEVLTATWSMGDVIEVRLCNVSGETLYRLFGAELSTNTYGFDVTGYVRGVYFVRVIYRDRQVAIGKVMVQ